MAGAGAGAGAGVGAVAEAGAGMSPVSHCPGGGRCTELVEEGGLLVPQTLQSWVEQIQLFCLGQIKLDLGLVAEKDIK